MNFMIVIIALSTAASLPGGELVLLTGSPTPKHPEGYASTLLRLDQQGKVQVVEEIVGDKPGTDWISANYDTRTVILVPRGGVTKLPITVLSFDRAGVLKACESPADDADTTGSSLIKELQLDIPGRGAFYAEHLMAGEKAPFRDILRGMSLDPAIPCALSWVVLSGDDLRFVAPLGYAGLPGIGSHDYVAARLDAAGRVTNRLSGATALLAQPVPEQLRMALMNSIAAIVSSNRSLTAIVLSESAEMQRVLVFRKSDSTWRHLKVSGSGLFSKCFGSFLAFPEVWPSANVPRTHAGGREWKRLKNRTGPSFEQRMDSNQFGFTGRLNIYDVEKEVSYRIETDQADSEILLVEDGKVYYRIANRLYEGRIAEKEITGTKLLATSDLLYDAHWAWIRR